MNRSELNEWKRRNKIAWCELCRSPTINSIQRDRFGLNYYLECQVCNKKIRFNPARLNRRQLGNQEVNYEPYKTI